MTFTVSANNFREALVRLKPATNNRSSEILKSILLQVNAESISLTAFNLSQGIVAKVEAGISSGVGSKVAVPYDLLTRIIANLEGELAFQYDNVFLHISCGTTEFSLSLPDAAEFPDLFKLDTPSHHFSLSSAKSLLKECSAIAELSLSGGVLTGVCFTPVENGIELAATDSHRLLMGTTEKCFCEERIILPADFVEAIAIAFRHEDDIMMARDGNLVKFSSPSTELIGRTLEGKYPDYPRLIPNHFKQELAIDADSLKMAIKMVSPLSNQKIVKCSIKDSSLQVSCNSELGIAHAEIAISAGFKEELTLGFNLEYLSSAINSLKGEITLKANDGNNPVLVCSEDYTHLLMPIQLNELKG